MVLLPLLRGGHEGADAVDRRCHYLRPGQAQLPGMSPEVSQRVEASLRDPIECAAHHILDTATFAPGGELADEAGYGLGLARLGELLQVREVHPLPAELYGA